MPGALRACATTGIRLSASGAPKKPATATGSHGPWLSGVWYQPWPAMSAVAASSPARVRPRPARTSPPYSTTQAAAAVAAVPAMMIARSFDFELRPYFQVEPAVHDAGPPSVDLSGQT